MVNFLRWAILLVSAPALADATADVRCREIQFSESVQAQDLELFMTFIDADARFVGDTVRRGPSEIAAAWSGFMVEGGPTIKWRPQIVEVLDEGSLALTRGPYLLTVTDNQGNRTEHWGTFNSVWRLNDDGQWRIVFDAGSGAAGPPSEEIQSLLDEDSDCLP